MLTVERLTLRFAGITAVHALSFSVRAGELLGIIGPNGAGKTSVLNAISGFYHPQEGRIVLFGRDITRLPPPCVCCIIKKKSPTKTSTGKSAVKRFAHQPGWGGGCCSIFTLFSRKRGKSVSSKTGPFVSNLVPSRLVPVIKLVLFSVRMTTLAILSCSSAW
uniref:ATP-binding cassette domain-containing protein n=1 Tax=Ammonifex degensii TaxID=42838 RepID=A0A7C2E2P3_9THEO